MKKIFSTIIFLIPAIANGAPLGEISNINNLATRIFAIGNIITYFLVSLAVVYIIWNIVHYYFIRPNGEDRKESGMNILWGIVGLFIIVSIWGLVNILVNTFYTDPRIPTDRFPNVDFATKNSPNNDFVDQPVIDIRDIPAGD